MASGSCILKVRTRCGRLAGLLFRFFFFFSCTYKCKNHGVLFLTLLLLVVVVVVVVVLLVVVLVVLLSVLVV